MNAEAISLTAVLLTFLAGVLFAALIATESDIQKPASASLRAMLVRRRNFYGRLGWLAFAFAMLAWLVAIWTADFS